MGIRQRAHGRSARRSARTVKCVSERNEQAGTSTDAEDCRRLATADHGFLPLSRHTGALSSARCTMDVRPVGAESQAPANRFCGSDASRDRHREADETADWAESWVVRYVRPPSAPHVVGCSSRLASLPQKKDGSRAVENDDPLRGVRRATLYFSSTRSMRNANAPAGCPAVNAMARTRARSAPLKPFSGTRISFHSGPASKLCMLGICCEPWNSIS